MAPYCIVLFFNTKVLVKFIISFRSLPVKTQGFKLDQYLQFFIRFNPDEMQLPSLTQ